MNKKTKILWFTGRSGAGKTTLVKLLKKKFDYLNITSWIIDGDLVREKRKKKFGFSKEEIIINNLEIVDRVKKKIGKYEFILVSVISPYEDQRKINRNLLGKDYYEVFVNCSLKEAMRRDPKGLYARAIDGEINNLIGFSESNPYENPQSPDIMVDTNNSSCEDSMNTILNYHRICSDNVFTKPNDELVVSESDHYKNR